MPVRRTQNWLPSIFNDFFDNEWMEKANATAPAINVLETEKEYKVELAAPGMTKDDFNVHIDEDNNLVISMEKKTENKEEKKDGRYLRREFSYSKFQQTMILPDNVDKEKIAAQVENGVLNINLPKFSAEEKQKKKKSIEGLKVVILGDIMHSRVARSNIYGLTKMGADVHLAGPRTMVYPELEKLGVTVHHDIREAVVDADVVNVLRIQLERIHSALYPTNREYARIFGINNDVLKLAKDDVMVMHPGPMNRGLEIAPDVAYSDQSVIQEQVRNGVAIRMAVLYLTIHAAPKGLQQGK